MNDATFQRLTQINDELVDLCNWLKQRADLETASRLAPIVDSNSRAYTDCREETATMRHMIVSQLPERVAVMAGPLFFSQNVKR